MKEKMKVMAGLISILAGALFLPGLIFAGDLEPSGPPTTGTMHTLDEIYTKLETIESSLGSSGSEGAPVAKTGQTTSYATGDDGDLGKGVAWPNPRFTDNGDGTVTDNLTNLIWLKNANCFGVKSWANAFSDCNGLANGSCGLSDGSVAGDWRLPNLRELQSLIHYGVYDPAVPNTFGTGKWTTDDPFTNVQSSSYLSSTAYAGYTSTSYAWFVVMDDGHAGKDDKGIYGMYVWPVRGGN